MKNLTISSVSGKVLFSGAMVCGDPAAGFDFKGNFSLKTPMLSAEFEEASISIVQANKTSSSIKVAVVDGAWVCTFKQCKLVMSEEALLTTPQIQEMQMRQRLLGLLHDPDLGVMFRSVLESGLNLVGRFHVSTKISRKLFDAATDVFKLQHAEYSENYHKFCDKDTVLVTMFEAYKNIAGQMYENGEFGL